MSIYGIFLKGQYRAYNVDMSSLKNNLHEDIYNLLLLTKIQKIITNSKALKKRLNIQTTFDQCQDYYMYL